MFSFLKKALNATVAPTKNAAHNMMENLGVLTKNIIPKMSSEQRNIKDFNDVLAIWNIEEKNIPQVIKDLKVRTVIFFIPILLSLVLAVKGMALTAILTFFSGVVGIITTLWRHHILVTRQYKSFPFASFIKKIFPQKSKD